MAGYDRFRLPIIPRVRERRREAQEYTGTRRRAQTESVAEKKQVSV